MTDIAELQVQVARIELRMLELDTPEAVAALRPARDAALAALRQAEERARVVAWGGFGQAESEALDDEPEHEPERPMTREQRLEEQRMILLCCRYARIAEVNARIFIDDRLSRALDQIGVEPRLKGGAFAIHRPKVRIVEDPESDYGMRTVVQVGDEQMELEAYLKNWATGDEEAAAYLRPGVAEDGRQKYRGQMSPLEISRFIREHGLAAYQALPYAEER